MTEIDNRIGGKINTESITGSQMTNPIIAFQRESSGKDKSQQTQHKV